MPLPPGLALNSSTGQITGVPSTPGTYSFDLLVRDSLGSARTVSESITVNAYTTLAVSGAAPDGTAGVAYSYPYSKTGGTAAYVWSVLSGALPTGVTLNTGTGQLTGTPSAGTFSYTIRVTDGIGATADVADSVLIVAALSLTGTLAKPTVGVAYSSGFTQAGGQSPYSYALTAGTLPVGLTLNASTGLITGTPTTTSSGAITIQVTDAFANTASASQTLTVAQPPSLSGTLPGGTNGDAYSASLTLTGGHTPFAWSILSGSLPTGLTINASSGLISGTLSAAGTFNFVVKVVDAAGNQATRSQSVVVAAAVVVSNAAPDGAVGVAFSHTYSVAGGTAPYTWSSTGTLPTGLSLNASTGKLSGTPSSATNFNFAVKATDALGAFGTLAETVNIASAVTLSGTLTNRGTLTVAYSSGAVTASNGTTPYVYSIPSGTVPGLSINSSTGTVSGTPTSVGSYSPTIRVTDARGSVANSVQALTIAAFPTLSGTLAHGTQSVAYSSGLTGANGHTPYVWDISTGTLPAGLSINSSTGVISGTPTTPATSNFTVRLTDDLGNVVTSAQSVTIAATLALSGSYAAGTQSTAYSSAITRTGGTAPFTFSLAGGSLPPGLSLNTGTGALTGTPTTPGSYSFTVKVVDSLGQQATSAQSISIAALTHTVSAPDINSSVVHPADASGSSTATVSGGIGPFTHSWAFAPGGENSFITLTGTTTATVTATVTLNAFPEQYQATVRDTVTDTGNGNLTATHDIGVFLEVT